MVRTIGLVLALGYVATAALAQGSQDPMEVCYQATDGPARLACFNHEMQRRHSAAATSPTTAVITKEHADDNVGLQGAELRKKLKEQGVQSQPVKPIDAAIVRLLQRPNSEYAFELDNGQTWEQTESVANLNLRAHDTVTIKPGLLGSFYMTTSRSQRVRVRRTR